MIILFFQTLLKNYRDDCQRGQQGGHDRLQGWLTKVKNGHSKKLWCILLGKMFVYFKSPGEPGIHTWLIVNPKSPCMRGSIEGV